jgi:hypothetical protein
MKIGKRIRVTLDYRKEINALDINGHGRLLSVSFSLDAEARQPYLDFDHRRNNP